MEITEYAQIIPAAGTFVILGTAWLTYRKIAKDAAKAKKEDAAAILHAAKEEDALMRIRLEAKIESLRRDLGNLEENIQKDMEHLKETYNGELRNLGAKIEDLRSDLKNQHGQLVQLLTEMIKKR